MLPESLPVLFSIQLAAAAAAVVVEKQNKTITGFLLNKCKGMEVPDTKRVCTVTSLQEF